MEIRDFTGDHPNRDQAIVRLLILAGRQITEDYKLEPKDRRLYKSYNYRLLIRPLILDEARRKNMIGLQKGKRARNILAIANKYKTSKRVVNWILDNYYDPSKNIIT